MIALSVAKPKMFSPESKIFLWIKPKKNFFVERLDRCRRLKVREKARNVFCDEPTSVVPQGVTQHRIFHLSLFSRFFRSYFVLQLFWSLRNSIKQSFHSRLLDMRLVIAIISNCRQYCFGLLGLISAVLMLRWRWTFRNHLEFPTNVVTQSCQSARTRVF